MYGTHLVSEQIAGEVQQGAIEFVYRYDFNESGVSTTLEHTARRSHGRTHTPWASSIASHPPLEAAVSKT